MTLRADSSADSVASIPEHVAIIMDGNGRWAASRGLPRVEGHRRGVEALRSAVKAAIEIGIRYLTVYSFSSENWRRPESEVTDLMTLARMMVRSDLRKLHASGVRIRVIGRRDRIAKDLLDVLDEAEALTASNDKLTLVVAFNYGGRNEIIDAVQKIISDVSSGALLPGEIDEQTISQRLNTHDIPDPDLVIRTSGEVRISNFLLWQSAYSEYVFTPTLWPDFDKTSLLAAIHDYQSRDRRFGAVQSES